MQRVRHERRPKRGGATLCNRRAHDPAERPARSDLGALEQLIEARSQLRIERVVDAGAARACRRGAANDVHAHRKAGDQPVHGAAKGGRRTARYVGGISTVVKFEAWVELRQRRRKHLRERSSRRYERT